MKLPEPAKIKSREMYQMFQFDNIEFFNPDNRSQTKYFYMNRFKRTVDLVELVLPKKEDAKILDIGCAQGNFSLVLGERYETIGIDLRLDFLKYAMMKKESSEDASFLRISGEDLCFKDKSFDLVLCNEVLEHVADPEQLITEVKRVLKPGGHLIVSTPNGSCLLFIFSKTFNDILKIPVDERKRILYTAGGHIFLFSEKEVNSLS